MCKFYGVYIKQIATYGVRVVTQNYMETVNPQSASPIYLWELI